MRTSIVVLSAAILLAGHVGRADVWDVGSDNDNTAVSTDNELLHGANQVHDLGALAGPVADNDFYIVTVQQRASYEVLVDATTGGLNFGASTVRRLDSDAATQLQTSENAGLAVFSRSLRWMHTASLTFNFIQVGPAGCGTTCTSNEAYRIRMYETTIGVARYNNTGTQTTVLMMQNTGGEAANATVYYWNASGVLVNQASFTINAKALAVISTSASTGATSGSITIANTAPYGTLNVKAVALEPATGFSFDSPGVYRPH
jgi:hypothetical protein